MSGSPMHLAPLLFLLGCPGADGPLTWFATCGDPVCGGYTGPTEGVPLCDTEAIGDACPEEGARCDPQDDCNALLTCTTEDPTAQPGGCPISRKRHKRDIHYLTPDETAALADKASHMALSTWSYRWETPGTPPHLGFLIDDNEGSFAVAADGEHVDLYGYTSLALAAAQAQDRRIAEQAALIATQEARLAEQAAKLADQERRISALEAHFASTAPAVAPVVAAPAATTVATTGGRRR